MNIKKFKVKFENPISQSDLDSVFPGNLDEKKMHADLKSTGMYNSDNLTCIKIMDGKTQVGDPYSMAGECMTRGLGTVQTVFRKKKGKG
jgi:hypothetical protein